MHSTIKGPSYGLWFPNPRYIEDYFCFCRTNELTINSCKGNVHSFEPSLQWKRIIRLPVKPQVIERANEKSK